MLGPAAGVLDREAVAAGADVQLARELAGDAEPAAEMAGAGSVRFELDLVAAKAEVALGKHHGHLS